MTMFLLASLLSGESKRIKAFRLSIANEIPKCPNDRSTLRTLLSLSLNTLFIHYLNWAYRYVSLGPRPVVIEPTASGDPRWEKLEPDINAFLEKVKTGQDLTPHLSSEPRTRGYTPASSKRGSPSDLWQDKDFLLNVMGFHHFHLGLNISPKGLADRSDTLLFARVYRDTFVVLGLFDHSVFDQPPAPKDSMTDERERLWRLYNEYASRGLQPGSVYVLSPITTSGHPLHLVRMADDYAYQVRTLDPRLDDPAVITSLYESAGLPCPNKPKLKWQMNYLDLGLLDSASDTCFIVRKGPS